MVIDVSGINVIFQKKQTLLPNNEKRGVLIKIWANKKCSDLHYNTKFLIIRQKSLPLLGYHIYSGNV